MRESKKPLIVDRRNEGSEAAESRARDANARAETAEREASADASSRELSASAKRAKVSEARAARSSAEAAQGDAGIGAPVQGSGSMDGAESEIDRVEAERNRAAEVARRADAERAREAEVRTSPTQPSSQAQPVVQGEPRPSGNSPERGSSHEQGSPESAIGSPRVENAPARSTDSSQPQFGWPAGSAEGMPQRTNLDELKREHDERLAQARMIQPSEHTTARQMLEMQDGQRVHETNRSAVTADGPDSSVVVSEHIRGNERQSQREQQVREDVEKRQGAHAFEDDRGAAFPEKSESRSGPGTGNDDSDSNAKNRKGTREHHAGAFRAPAQSSTDSERREIEDFQREARDDDQREARTRRNDRTEERNEQREKVRQRRSQADD